MTAIRFNDAAAACVQQTSGYHLGFADAAELEPLFDDAHPDYSAGWKAYWDIREALSAFTTDGGVR